MQRKPGSTTARRGVLLLVVLSLLAMFGLIAITYLVVTNQAVRTARTFDRLDQQVDPPDLELHQAAMQVIRGASTNVAKPGASALEGHSLLEGVYGNSWSVGMMRHYPGGSPATFVVAGPPFSTVLPYSTTGQLIYFHALDVSGASVTDVAPYVGRVLTMLEGPAAGLSTRIVACEQGTSTDPGKLQIVAFNGVSTADVVNYLQGATSRKCRFVINGPAFAGMGRGYNSTSGALDSSITLNPTAATVTGETALLPNTAFQPVVANESSLRLAPGGANVDYTAVDYNNMLPALTVSDPTTGTSIFNTASTPYRPYGLVAVPSLHRQELVRYWINLLNPSVGNEAKLTGADSLTARFLTKPGTAWTELEWKQFKRRLVLRPLVEDHPNFTGSNPRYSSGSYSSGFNPLWDPYLDGIQGSFAWDVDNDRDGIPDSIWVDVGLPVRTARDGRRYKPLVAILCKDLDGRLNLNAHGCPAQAQDYYSDVSLASWNILTGSSLYFSTGTATPSQTAPGLRGQGWGPADVSLRPILSATELTTLLNYRYWDSGANVGAGITNVTDALVQNRLFNYWNDGATVLRSKTPGTFYFNYWDFLTNPATYQLNSFASPPSFKTFGAVGLDVRGAPIYAWMGQTAVPVTTPGDLEQVDSPYEFRLQATSGSTSSASADKPYTPAELARVVSPFDADAGALPPRLFTSLTSHREEVTTEGWDVPAVGVALPPTLQTRLLANTTAFRILSGQTSGWNTGWGGDWTPAYPPYPPRHIRDVMAIKLYLDSNSDKAVTGRAMTTNALGKLLPYEMLRGLKMNLNRPFGNGLDDSPSGAGYRVVDEPGRVTRTDAGGGPTGAFLLDTNYPGEVLLDRFAQVGSTLTSATIPYYNDIQVAFNHINSVDVNGDGTVDDSDRAMARQLYARQLYVLGLLAFDHTVADTNNPDQGEQDRARMVAQWAVNVVDFYDRDSIMTPFEYDIAPFVQKSTQYGQGVTWNVDGVIDNPNLTGYSPASDDSRPYRGLVWGCERPELLITEVLAMHDRRTQDLPADPRVTPPGSGLVYNNPSGNDEDAHHDFDQGVRPEGSLFVELYNPSPRLEPKTGEFYNAVNGGVDLTKAAPDGTPVWRLAIYATLPTDPDDPTSTVHPERSVYFRDAQNISVTNDGHRHYTQAPPTADDDRVVYPGRYAVIGSGRTADLTAERATTTYLGFRSGMTAGDADTRRIELYPYHSAKTTIAPVGVYRNKNDDKNDLDKYTIQTPVTIVIDRAGTNANSLRLSVSEPTGGYPVVDANGNDMTADYQYQIPYPSPLDRYQPNSTTDNDPNLWPILAKDGTASNFRFVYLQRLANPLLPWDERSNPYRTVDMSPIDLVTFNGATATAEPSPDGGNAAVLPSVFVTRERGGNSTGSVENNVWEQEPVNVNARQPRDTVKNLTTHVFQTGLSHTLGFLNWSLNQSTASANLGPRGAISGDTTYQGDPREKPFPWLTWNNRPFASPLELLLVPTTSANELLKNSTGANLTLYPFGKLFGLLQSGSPYSTKPGLFPHLMNFFLQAEPPISAQSPPAMMHRLLEYVTVPSLFTGTETQFNPTTFASNSGHIFAPPFNTVSNYREPGRINLNTTFSSYVWQGLLNRQDLGNGNILDDFLFGRQGYGPTLGAIKYDLPTRFARPFRSSAGKYLVPPSLAGAVGDEINCTVLRPSSSEPTRPLLSFDASGSSALITQANDPTRNPYFYYQQLMRQGNLTTTRSNVFAVWLTVGYFEALPAGTRPTTTAEALDYDAVYPEGCTWGQEMGIESGEVKRHRAFYIIDRTIPVGFQRGVDLNAEKAILLKRFIE